MAIWQLDLGPMQCLTPLSQDTVQVKRTLVTVADGRSSRVPRGGVSLFQRTVALLLLPATLAGDEHELTNENWGCTRCGI